MGKCYICGNDAEKGVECKHGYFRQICSHCYNNEISKVSEIQKMDAKIEAILEVLSDCQMNVAESIANQIIEKQAFSEIYKDEKVGVEDVKN